MSAETPDAVAEDAVEEEAVAETENAAPVVEEADNGSVEDAESAVEEPYPAPDDVAESDEIDPNYPAPTARVFPEGYPVPTDAPELPLGPDFFLNKPINAGDTQVSGTGPAGVPILLVNVSELGTPIAETLIDDDGVFVFEFDNPLESGHTVGIQIGDLGAHPHPEYTYSSFIRSTSYSDMPMVGILFDKALIE